MIIRKTHITDSAGRASSVPFARHGARVAVPGRDPDAADVTVNSITEAGVRRYL